MKAHKTGRKTAPCSAKPPFRDRPVPPPPNRGRTGDPVAPTEIAEWVRKAKDLPDIRWDKVKAIRDALAGSQFDLDARLAQLRDKMPDELITYLQQLADRSDREE